MVRFVLQAVASAVVVASLAVFDIGPQLNAGLISYADLVFQRENDFAPYPGGASSQSESEVLFPKPGDGGPLHSALLTAWCTHSGGAGPQTNSHTSPTSSTTAHPGILTQARHERQLTTFLCAQREARIPDSIPSSIFHPPRRTSRG